MPEQPHLPFRRVPRPARVRRRVRRSFPRETRYEDRTAHAGELRNLVFEALADVDQRRVTPEVFDPKLILRFALNSRVADDVWRRTGLVVLDSSETDAAVVFSADAELSAFRERLAAYSRGVGDGRETAAYEDLFDAIDSFGGIAPADRIAARLAAVLIEDPDLARPMDVEFWFVGDIGLLEAWMDQARRVVETAGGVWLDELTSPAAGIALARIEGNAAVAQSVALLDQVVAVDSVPEPRLPQAELVQLQHVDQYASVVQPADDAPVVGLVDSGLAAGHPLLAPAVIDAVALHPEFGGQAEDINGHGTMVAGRVLFGDVLRAARQDDFVARFWLASVRVLDDRALVPLRVNWVRAIADAIEYLATAWDARVINLSIGDATSPYIGGKSTPLAAELDALARAYDLVIVISAGNLSLPDLEPYRGTFARYPEYLLSDDFELIDPAQAALGITVGALAEADGVTPHPLGTRLGSGAVARADGPSPFTRHGPGVRKAIKPELAADGGNLVFDRPSGNVQPDPAVEVLSTTNRFPTSLFATSVGSSFAAPAVAHIAGRLATDYPAIDGTTIRALLLQGATVRPLTAEVINSSETDVQALCGFGCVSWERCGESSDNRVVLYATDTLRIDDFHVYRIPMLPEFTDVSGEHRLTVALSYSPPVRHRRFDYVAFGMEFVVVRGVGIGDVFEMAGVDIDDPAAGRLSGYELSMRPPRTVRSRGCNQAASWSSASRPRERFRDDWYVVVRSLNHWMPRGAPAEPYSLAIALEVDRAEELYLQLAAELEVEVEVQI